MRKVRYSKIRPHLARLAGTVRPWALATLVAASAGSLIQSQLNLATISTLGAPVDFTLWLKTVVHDLVAFMPFYALLVGAAFFCAFPVALLFASRRPAARAPLLLIAGATGLAMTFFIANLVAPVPTLIAATRGPLGYIAMLSTGVLGGWVFGKTHPRPRPLKSDLSIGVALVFPVAMLAAALAFHLAMRPERAHSITDISIDNYRVTILADGLVHPWGMVFLPDGRKLVTERVGRVRVIDQAGALLKAPLEGVPDALKGGQGGLLDIKLSPRFEQDSYIFLTHSCGTPEANNTCVSRGELRGNALHNVRRIFQARPLKDTNSQYGSRITFLPDNTLVASIGDGFDFREQAQDPTTHFGKLVRLNLDGSVPRDNPFVGKPGYLPEIYSYGHRNPQGLWYDGESGRLYESEHGPYGGDEVNIIKAGGNYGWPLTTDGINYPGDYVSPYKALPETLEPIHHWTPSIAPSNIILYRGEEFPDLDGDLLVAGLSGKGVFRLRLNGDRVIGEQRLFHELDKRIRLVTVGPEGVIYLLTDHNPGQVLRILATDS